MKKYLICMVSVLLVAVLALALTSCGEGDTDKTDSEPNAPASNLPVGDQIDFSSIIAGNGSTGTIWGQQDAASRQQIIGRRGMTSPSGRTAA